MRIDILTIFPGFFTGPLDYGVLKRAIATGLVEVRTHDLRRFTKDRHRTVDDRPFGGGEGMVLKPEPIYAAFQTLGIAEKAERETSRETVVSLSAQGRPFTQAVAHTIAAAERIVLLCGRYEGIDERINSLVCDRELSIGDYVLSGGELAAAVVLDSVVRLLPGVLGNPDSSRFESFSAEVGVENAGLNMDGVPASTHLSGGLLDYPHYTRPAEFLGHTVPQVLQAGDHSAVRRWRQQMALEKTWRNRPDLLAGAVLSREDREFLSGLNAREAARETARK